MSTKTTSVAALIVEQVRNGLAAREFSAVELTKSALEFANRLVSKMY